MALNLITNPPTVLAVSGDWTTFLTRSNKNMVGHGLSIPIFTLTNWDGTTTIPAIAEGSIIEVGNSFYQADADTALTPEGGIIDGTVHIKLVPGAGSPDPLTVVPTLTNDAIPAWDGVKGGWYDLADKFLPFEMTKASAVYTNKSEYIDQNKTIKITSEGFYDLTVNNDLTVSNNVTVNNSVKSNTIAERTIAAGVTIDGVLLKDGAINTDNAALKQKVVSGIIAASSNNVTIAHGLTAANIRGISVAADNPITAEYVNEIALKGPNILVRLSTATAEAMTVYCTVSYV